MLPVPRSAACRRNRQRQARTRRNGGSAEPALLRDSRYDPAGRRGRRRIDRPVHQPVALERPQRLSKHPFGDVADSDAGAAKGALHDDSHTLRRLIGRPATPWTEILAAHPALRPHPAGTRHRDHRTSQDAGGYRDPRHPRHSRGPPGTCERLNRERSGPTPEVSTAAWLPNRPRAGHRPQPLLTDSRPGHGRGLFRRPAPCACLGFRCALQASCSVAKPD